jgi:hypothetical protein
MRFSLYRPCDGNGAMCAEKILATGDIELDSASKLLAFVRSPQFQATGIKTPTIAFDSAGGNVVGAMTLGRLIRRLGADTYLASRYESHVGFNDRIVASHVICASACTLAFMGGVQRVVEPDARYGVHQFYARHDIGDRATQNVIVAMAAYIEEMGVDRGVLDVASMVPPEKMYWLPPDAIQKLGVDNTQSPLAPWSIRASKDGRPFISVRQRVAAQREVYVGISQYKDSFVVSVAAILDRPLAGRFPVGDDVEIAIEVDGRPIPATPLGPWAKFKGDRTGSTFYANLVISRSDLLRLAKARTLAISDGFANAIRDVSFTTPLSTDQLSAGAALLLRMQ